ncbi:MAG: hypothetical protein VX259_04210, partial [Pseudomonadota bacterium]|nr:hypothetical protein [Pseudomonadota bacterium]
PAVDLLSMVGIGPFLRTLRSLGFSSLKLSTEHYGLSLTLGGGEVSLLAWEVLDEGVDDYVAVSDEAAVEVMQLLAAGVEGDSPLVAGESAVAGLAGLLIAQQDPELGARLGLTAESRVLLIGSEGATDDDVYRELVGSSADEVRSGQFRAREVGHVS